MEVLLKKLASEPRLDTLSERWFLFVDARVVSCSVVSSEKVNGSSVRSE